jgi:hypothetical protein
LKATLADAAASVSVAQSSPDAWWVGYELGSEARQLLMARRGDLLVRLYDRHYSTAADFHDHFLDFANVGPPVALALRAAGRTADAVKIEELLQRDLDAAAAQGEADFALPLRRSWLASLHDDAPGAARHLRSAINLGWRAQDEDSGLSPRIDPMFGAVASSPEFKSAVSAFDSAVANERTRFLGANFSRLPI